MAAFKVGQRVRIVNNSALVLKQFAGCEVVILGLPGWSSIKPENYEISKPSTDAETGFRYGAPAEVLVPLTDPSADQFIARIKKLGSEPVNDAPKVTVREGK